VAKSENLSGNSVVATLEQSYEQCRLLTGRTAHNFKYTFLTLPPHQRPAMEALYAFNRITDDLGDDESVSVEERKSHLFSWRQLVQNALSKSADSDRIVELEWNRDSSACLPAIANVVDRFHIPHEYLFAVIDGVAKDLNPFEIETYQQLQEYSYLVAGAVGLSCLHIWGFRDSDEVRSLAIDCGLAMQLTNILRDLGEDIERGRVYLPTEDLDRFGYSRDDLVRRTRNEQFQKLMTFEVERAKQLYRNSERLMAFVDRSGRPILRAMLDIYGGVLREMTRRDYDVFSKRIALPKWKKLWYAGRAIVRNRFRIGEMGSNFLC